MLSNETVGDLKNKVINTYKVVEDGETLFVREHEDEEVTIYYRNSKGQYHRRRGQAVNWKEEFKVGEQRCLNGKKHREDGPAFIRNDGGDNEYCLNGEFIPKKEFLKFMAKNRIRKLY